MKSILGSLLLITEGSLLVKYLGVTLTTRRLKTEDCNQFKKKKRQHEGQEFSHGRRAQLVSSVLILVSVYSSIFNSPSEIIKKSRCFGPSYDLVPSLKVRMLK